MVGLWAGGSGTFARHFAGHFIRNVWLRWVLQASGSLVSTGSWNFWRRGGSLKVSFQSVVAASYAAHRAQLNGVLTSFFQFALPLIGLLGIASNPFAIRT